VASEADRAREDFMADGIAWALAEADAGGGGAVVVVCGGFHQAALERLVAGRPPPPAPPRVEPPPPALARTGSYLVPFSFFRLDSFTGYASGMPSPAFYQALWDDPAGAPETMAMAAVTRLRGRGQRVSTADAIAAVELSHGLARLRGHAAPTRCDVLDGLAAALIKDALRTPVPWSARTVLARGTDPYLVEIVAAFSGDRAGALAPGTPQPPLVADLAAELAAVGLAFTQTPTPIRIDIFAPDAAARRRVRYRLRGRGGPGVQRGQRADRNAAAPSRSRCGSWSRTTAPPARSSSARCGARPGRGGAGVPPPAGADRRRRFAAAMETRYAGWRGGRSAPRARGRRHRARAAVSPPRARRWRGWRRCTSPTRRAAWPGCSGRCSTARCGCSRG
jgi:hypothetical protein